MTTDWWSSTKQGEIDVRPLPTPPPPSHAEPSPAITPIVEPGPEVQAPENEEVQPSGVSRTRAMKVVGLVAGATVAGALIVGGMHDGGEQKKPSITSAEQSEELPAAGGGPEASLPSGDEKAVPGGQDQTSASAAPRVVTLAATPSGRGRTGAVMKLTVHNGTDSPVIVLASMVKGDGHSAIVGEGTLAPGSRTVQPGETVTGTVEFSTAAAPHQVALLDLSGNVVAASDES